MKWYGSIDNRLEEGRMYCDQIEVGTGVTEYLWSDRRPYEVVGVKDQKHVTVRAMDHRPTGEPMSNRWELVSNPDRPARNLERRGDVWYWTTTITAEDVAGLDRNNQDDLHQLLRLALAGFDVDTIRAKGKQTKRSKANVSFGTAQYYYDYEF